MSLRGPRGARLVLAVALMVIAGASLALNSVRLTVTEMSGPGWSTGPVRLDLSLGEQGFELTASAERLALAPPLDRLERVSLRCSAAAWVVTRIHCPDAVMTLESADAPQGTLRAAVTVDTTGGYLDVRVPEQPLADGRLSLELKLDDTSARVHLAFSALRAATVQPLLVGLGAPADIAASEGTVSGELRVRQDRDSGEIEGTVRVQGLAFSGPQGLRAGEALDIRLDLGGRRTGQAWRFDTTATMGVGLVYVDPLLLDVSSAPVTLEAHGVLTTGQSLEVQGFTLTDPQGAVLSGVASVDLAGPAALAAFSLRMPPVTVHSLYERYLRAFTGAGLLSELVFDGHVSAELDWRAETGARALLTVDQLDLGDGQGRFAVLGLDGEVHWSDGDQAPPSSLSWRSVQLASLDLGEASVHARMWKRDLALTAPLEVDVLDGGVRVTRLQARGLGLASQRVEADVVLLPISLGEVSQRLAWLPLAGSVSGRFPDLVYAEGQIEVGSDIVMELFDGQVVVSGLSLQDPFDPVPVLRAGLSLKAIDLGLLTRALSFGSIQGQLEGSVQGLVMEGWRPVAFDAVLATPPDDPIRHRISQRAVDNLASLGGANAVLSSTFLRFFKEFSYDRLGLSCRLRAGVCEMGGVAPAPRGYYIVKGGGLPPRVDVVGFNTRVDWNTLLERLEAVTGAEGPVVR